MLRPGASAVLFLPGRRVYRRIQQIPPQTPVACRMKILTTSTPMIWGRNPTGETLAATSAPLPPPPLQRPPPPPYPPKAAWGDAEAGQWGRRWGWSQCRKGWAGKHLLPGHRSPLQPFLQPSVFIPSAATKRSVAASFTMALPCSIMQTSPRHCFFSRPLPCSRADVATVEV